MEPKVLVVDDDPSVLYTVELVLSEADVPVSTAESGHHCLDLLARGFRGLILLDIMMPGMDGYETVREIVRRGWMDGNLVCMLTAVMDPDEELAPASDGVLEYVRKPFHPDELVSTVREYLGYLV
jgi:CheY-like chemotaxis protein